MPDDGRALVFISHASEDKERFVIPFATQLRQRGIDAWVDRWEIVPGDSLVDKIFEEGLKAAAAVIVVLSQFSVAKPWVREELNAGVVARINRGARLIPIVLDDVDVPEALRGTVWVTIRDLNDFTTELDSVVAALLRKTQKPPLGPVPEYASAAFAVAGLNNQDAAVLRIYCEAALAQDAMVGFRTEELITQGEAVGLRRAQFLESAQVLAESYLLERDRVLLTVPNYSLRHAGLERYLRATMSNYHEISDRVAAFVANNDRTSNREIATALKLPTLLVVEHILDMLESRGLLKQAKAIGRISKVHSVSPRLRRMLEGGA